MRDLTYWLQAAGYEPAASRALAKAAEGTVYYEAMQGAVALLNVLESLEAETPLAQAAEKLARLVCAAKNNEGGQDA